MDLAIKGRTAVITGGDSGIGLATAKFLASEGTHIILNDKTTERLEKAAAEVREHAGESPYNACKAGIINLAKCLSRAYSPEGVMINCVSPAYIATPMTDEMMEDWLKSAALPKKRLLHGF